MNLHLINKITFKYIESHINYFNGFYVTNITSQEHGQFDWGSMRLSGAAVKGLNLFTYY